MDRLRQGKFDSSFVFELAGQYELPLKEHWNRPITDHAIDSFCDDYLKSSDSRDLALAQHLRDSNHLFRAYLPYTKRALIRASQLVWYYDETILRDPVRSLIDVRRIMKPEEFKYRLVDCLSLLSTYRSAIEEGYILLAQQPQPPPIFAFFPEAVQTTEPAREFSPLVSALYADRSIQSELHNSVQFGYQEYKHLPEGHKVVLYKAGLERAQLVQGHITLPPYASLRIEHVDLYDPPQGDSYSPTNEIRAALLKSMTAIGVFHSEIDQILKSIVFSHELNSYPVFDRLVDSQVLRHPLVCGEPTPRPDAKGLELILPYIPNVPGNVLASLRAEMPDSFHLFRLRLVELVEQAQAKEAPFTQLERSIREDLAKIRAEMEIVSRRKHLLQCAVGGATSLAFAAFVGSYMMNPDLAGLYHQLGSLVWPLAGVTIAAGGPTIDSTARARANPFYFLWRASSEPTHRSGRGGQG